MQFGEMFRVLRRRWFISVPVLLLTIVASVGAYLKLPPTYQTNAELTLIASKTLSSYPGNGDNPYLSLGTLVPMTGILISELSSHQAEQDLAQLGVVDSLSVAVPAYDPGPFLTLTLSGKDSTRLLQSMPTVIKFAKQQLYAMQQAPVTSTSVPANSQIKAVVISSPSTPSPVTKKKREVVVGVAIGGIIALLLLSFGVEAIARRRGNGTQPKDGGLGSGRRAGDFGAPVRAGDFDGVARPVRQEPTIPVKATEPQPQQERGLPARSMESAFRQSTFSNELSLESEK